MTIMKIYTTKSKHFERYFLKYKFYSFTFSKDPSDQSHTNMITFPYKKQKQT